MKICRIVYAFPPHSFGGADIYAEKISKALESYGNKSVVITINPDWRDSIEKQANRTIYGFHPLNVSTVHHIGKKSTITQGVWSLLDLYSLYSYNKIRNILKKERPDVVHIHTPLDVTISTFDAIRNLGFPIVFTLHDYLLLCRRVVLLHGSGEICTEKNINPLCKIYRRFVNKSIDDKVDIVIGSSQFVLDMHKKHGFFKNTKSIILSHGIELNNQSHKNTGNSPKGKCFQILYIGSLTRHKGVHIIIEALKQINNENIKLNIVGDGIYANELKCFAKGDQRINFCGEILNNQVQSFFDAADITIVPSIWYDVRPNVIVESFRSGVPVIASKIGGIPELVKENYNGFLFEPSDAKQLKHIIQRIIEKPDVLLELRDNAFKSIKDIEMSKYIKRLITVYEEAVKINKDRKLC